MSFYFPQVSIKALSDYGIMELPLLPTLMVECRSIIIASGEIYVDMSLTHHFIKRKLMLFVVT